MHTWGRSNEVVLMRQTMAAGVGLHISILAWAVFVVTTDLVAAAAFMIGVFSALVTLGLVVSCCIEQHSDRVVGWLWRSRYKLPQVGRRDLPPSRCALCHHALQQTGGLRVCSKCDLVRSNT